MRNKILLFIICLLIITLTVGCKKTEKSEKSDDIKMQDTSKTESSNDDSDTVSEETTKPIYTIKELSKEMLLQKATNVYSEPSTESTLLGQLSANEKITVTGKVNGINWYQVSYNNNVAYIPCDDLTDIKPDATPPTSSDATPPTSSDTTPPTSSGSTPPTTPTTTPTVTKEVKDLDVASKTDQIILVAVNGTKAKVSMHQKTGDGSWNTLFSSNNCYIGKNGLGKTKEGDKKTPIGVYRFTMGFGVKTNPGTQLKYTVIDSSHYWVDDSNSQYYNKFVSTNAVTKDWSSAEHLIDYPVHYSYALALDYNSACTPGKGSAIFFHCINRTTTSGCIAIPEQYMIEILKNVNGNCAVIIDTEKNIWNY